MSLKNKNFEESIRSIFQSIGSYNKSDLDNILKKLSNKKKENFLNDKNIQESIKKMIKIDNKLKELPTSNLSSENKKRFYNLSADIGK